MKHFLFFISTIFYLNVFSQQIKSVQSIKPNEKTRQQLLQKMEEFTEAWGRSDTTALRKLLANDYRHSDIWGKLLHKQDWLMYAATPRAISNLVTSDIEMLLYNKKIAVVTGRMSYHFDEEKVLQEIRFTQMWVNNNGQWKRTTFQATLIDKSK